MYAPTRIRLNHLVFISSEVYVKYMMWLRRKGVLYWYLITQGHNCTQCYTLHKIGCCIHYKRTITTRRVVRYVITYNTGLFPGKGVRHVMV